MNRALKTDETIQSNVKDVKPYDRDKTILAMEQIDFSEGHIIPSSWFHHVSLENGRPDGVGIILLAEIVGWYRRVATNNVIDFSNPCHQSSVLKTCVQDFITNFNLSLSKTVRSFDRLEKNGFILRQFEEPNKKRGKHNVTASFFVMPDADAIKKITYER